MKDLRSVDLSFDDFELESLDVWNEEHVSVLNGFRDDDALDMCYDVLVNIERERNNLLQDDNLYLAKNGEGYFGYLCITNSVEGNRELAYIIQERLRNKGLGTIMLNAISNFLLGEDVETSSVLLHIRFDNVAGINLATKCGFMKTEENSTYDTYEKRLVNR